MDSTNLFELQTIYSWYYSSLSDYYKVMINSSAMFALQRRHRRRCPVREKVAPFGYLALKISSCRRNVHGGFGALVFMGLFAVASVRVISHGNSLDNYRTDLGTEQNTLSFLCLRLNPWTRNNCDASVHVEQKKTLVWSSHERRWNTSWHL